MKPAATHWLPPATLCKPQVFVAAIDAGLEAVSRLLRTVRVAAHCPTPPRSPRRLRSLRQATAWSWLRQRRPIPQVSRPPGSAAAPCRTTGNPWSQPHKAVGSASRIGVLQSICKPSGKVRPQRSPWRSAPAFHRAEVAELADAHGSGPCTRKGVGVRVPSSAPKIKRFSNIYGKSKPSKDLLGFHMFGFCLLSRSRCPL